MRLVVLSHKACWPASGSQSGYATDGGFPYQMRSLSELFEETTLVLPCWTDAGEEGLQSLTGNNLTVRPLTPLVGRGVRRKLMVPFWLVRNSPAIVSAVWESDAVHAPIPGDVGTIGMLLAFLLRKPLFVRHCGNWLLPKTAAEHFWKWFMERFAGGKRVMLATGGAAEPPSKRNSAIRWIFSTTLTERELNSGFVRSEVPSDGPVRLIIACRQDQEKGAGVTISSLPLIAESFPQVHLDIVGDGLALDEFKRLASALGISDRVSFHGKLEHGAVLGLMRQAHLFCYPTAASEGFPKVVLEALACGLPVITTRVSVLPQLIGKGCGILLDVRSPSAMADAAINALSDIESYKRMSKQAVETAREYSLERWRDTIGELLQAAWHQGQVAECPDV